MPSSLYSVPAYFEYTTASDVPNALADFSDRPRLVVLRTFSKVHGLAGLRVGYGIMDPELADYLERVRQPYNVSTVGQVAAAAAIEDENHVDKSRRMVRLGMEQLGAGLRRIGLQSIASQANFLVIKLPFDGDPVQAELRKRGILVRAMAGYGMPNSIRITVGPEEVNARVLGALAEIMG